MHLTTRKKGKTLAVWAAAAALVVIASGAAIGAVLSGSINGIMPVSVSQALLLDGLAFGTDDITWPDGTYVPRAIASTHDSGRAFSGAAEISTGDKFLIQLPLQNRSRQAMTGIITLEAPQGTTLEIAEHSILPITAAVNEDAAARGWELTPGTHTGNVRYWPIADSNNDGKVDASDIDLRDGILGTSVTVLSVNALMGTVTYQIPAGPPLPSLVVSYIFGSEINVVAKVAPNQWEFTAPVTLGTNMSGDVEVIIANADNSAPGYHTVKGTIKQFTLNSR